MRWLDAAARKWAMWAGCPVGCRDWGNCCSWSKLKDAFGWPAGKASYKGLGKGNTLEGGSRSGMFMLPLEYSHRSTSPEKVGASPARRPIWYSRLAISGGECRLELVHTSRRLN